MTPPITKLQKTSCTTRLGNQGTSDSRFLTFCLVLTAAGAAVILKTRAQADEAHPKRPENANTLILATAPKTPPRLYMAMKGPDGTNTNLRALNLWWKDKKRDMTVALTSDDNRITLWSVPNDADPAKQITQINLTANNDEYNKVTVYLGGKVPATPSCPSPPPQPARNSRALRNCADVKASATFAISANFITGICRQQRTM